MDLIDEHRKNTEPGPFYEPEGQGYRGRGPKIRLIAYYLPQFHPIPQNDAAWGKGFTEWTNVTKATPAFSGHYQPQLPGDLGFYDLRSIDVIRRQAEMAKKYGIYGFCFHHYWFDGTPVLDTPLKLFLSDPSIDLPFCINWANENWTRRWDGKENEVIIAQRYSAEDDLAFARSLEPLLRDPRYIRIDGRPLIMLYKPADLPDVKATLQRWRDHFVRAGLGDPYLLMPEEFEGNNPGKYGFDGAAGYPPRSSGISTRMWRVLLRLRKRHFRRGGLLCSYDQMMAHGMSDRPKDFTLFPGICPGWDNTARKGLKGHVYLGANPNKYGVWLKEICKHLKGYKPEHRIIFVNAWNEWAEGAHLEPDRYFGHAYLAETARTLELFDDMD